jgi:hypothetical protein
MALTVPAIQDFEAYKGESFDLSEYAAVTMHLQAATDLMEIATGIHQDFPNNTLEYRLMRNGIFDMAWFIGTSMEDRDAMFSPFSSERIGSYSYNKSAKAVSMQGDTGIPFFDMAVNFLAGSAASESLGGVSSTSTHVMPDYGWYKDSTDFGPYGYGVDG